MTDPVLIALMDRLQAPVWLVALALTAYLTARTVVWIKAARDPGPPLPANGGKDAMKVHRAELAGAWRQRMEGLALSQQKLMERMSEEFRRSNELQGQLLDWMRKHQEGADARGEIILETHRLVERIHQQRSA